MASRKPRSRPVPDQAPSRGRAGREKPPVIDEDERRRWMKVVDLTASMLGRASMWESEAEASSPDPQEMRRHRARTEHAISNLLHLKLLCGCSTESDWKFLARRDAALAAAVDRLETSINAAWKSVRAGEAGWEWIDDIERAKRGWGDLIAPREAGRERPAATHNKSTKGRIRNQSDRVIAYLLERVGQWNQMTKDGQVPTLLEPQKTIASQLGVSTATVSRVFRKLKISYPALWGHEMLAGWKSRDGSMDAYDDARGEGEDE